MDRESLIMESAKVLFDGGNSGTAVIYEPRNPTEANAAVLQFARSFEELPATIASALDAARNTGELLSDDRFQGLAEIVQNADDAEASCVRMLLRPSDLLVSHNGKPVRLRHLLGLATPWLSTKGGDADTIGRFGIGLMTLRSLSDTIEVHCHPYHVRLGEPTLSPIDPPSLPPEFQESGWTTFRIPLEVGAVSLDQIKEWLANWDDAALLFLSHVSRIELIAADGMRIRELLLSRSRESLVRFEGNVGHNDVLRVHAEASDGRAWAVYSTNVQSPSGVSRARKATGATTPIAVALPLIPVQYGEIYAGLPVAPARSALFLSAQFDPLASRRGFANTDWNRALVPLVAEMWANAVVDLFSRDPKLAWHTIPIGESSSTEASVSLVKAVEKSVVDCARQWVSSRLSFPVSEQGYIGLSSLAVEAPSLEGILSSTETSALAELPATLPSEIRDKHATWRKVLDDWRCAGADLPQPVSVERALDLIGDVSRPVDGTIALCAAALSEGLGERLLESPCVITSDGHHLVPPSGESPSAISPKAMPLALQLGVISILHSAYLKDDETARTVLAWLEECGALIDGTDNLEVVNRLAAAGRAGRPLREPLTDEQVMALRKAFELMNPVTRGELGPDVGRAISLECYTYEGKKIKTMSTRPHEAYLPRRIDRETDSFAVAAEKTPGLRWLSDKYADLLRSPTGRRGVGAQRFLRLLGANTAPILREHPHMQSIYARDPRGSLPREFSGSPKDRAVEMRKYDASHTLQDYDSPDLQAVADDIARERRKRTRRRRAAALIATLGRAWDRTLSDFAEVESAQGNYYWNSRGQIRAYWLWQLGDVRWLDDERGNARRPIDLRVRTPGNVAIYGDDCPDFLHKDLHQPNRELPLRAIGVSSDPSRSELVDRLRLLRDESVAGEHGLSSDGLKQEVAVVYKALARDLEETPRSDLSVTRLRAEFGHGKGLLLTDLGWLPPRSVLAGPPIFGNLAAFAPAVAGTDRLWRVLNLREPTAENCLKVVQSIARKRGVPDGSEKTILLETMRALARHYTNEDTPKPNKRRLSGLALWTSKGWSRKRPVFATNDPMLGSGLRDQIPLWEPGGDLEQFRSLIDHLRIQEIQAADAEVIEPAIAYDDDATDLFRSALKLLREDLARNEPRLAESIKLSWDALEEFEVSVQPSLSLLVRVRRRGGDEEYKSEVDAKVVTALGRVFVKEPRALSRVDKGGRALAELFEGSKRRVAQSWRAACDKAEDGLEAQRIILARQHAEQMMVQNEKGIERRTAELRDWTSTKRSSAGDPATKVPAPGTNGHAGKGGQKAAELGPPRTLVDPESLKIAHERGRIEEKVKPTHSKSIDGEGPRSTNGLSEPKAGSTAPRNRRPIPGYSPLDRENVGMDLLRMIFGTRDNEIIDVRAQKGVGADAVDSKKSYYELKVSAGPEPDQVTLTRSEVERAQITSNYYLVIVSEIEGTDARPKVRVFVDPLNQLTQTHHGSVTLSGIHSAKSVVYEFEPADDAVSSGNAVGREVAASS